MIVPGRMTEIRVKLYPSASPPPGEDHGVALFCPTRTSIFKSRSFLSKGIYNPLPLVENAEGEPDSMKNITNHFSVIKG